MAEGGFGPLSWWWWFATKAAKETLCKHLDLSRNGIKCVFKREQQDMDVSIPWPMKTPYLPFYSQTIIIKPFPDI